MTGGSITLDGVDIRDLTRTDLRTHMAMAFEDATLFSASVRDNVMLGRPEGTEDDLREALDISQASFSTTSPRLFNGVDRAGFEAVQKNVHQVKYGYDGYAYTQVASGNLDIVIESAKPVTIPFQQAIGIRSGKVLPL